MPLSFILAMIGVGIYFVVIIIALMIHGIWLAPFVERHGKRTAGFLTWTAGVGLVLDYLTARQLCHERGISPWWMRWFASLLVVAGVLAALIIIYVLLEIFWR